MAIGDAMTEDTAKRIRRVAAAMDEHFEVSFRQDKVHGGVVLTILTR